MAIKLIDTDARYGQEDYPGRLVTNNFERLLEIPLKFIIFPCMLCGFPLFLGVFIVLASDSHIAKLVFPYYGLALYLGTLSLYRNYHVVSYFDKQHQSIHEETYLYRKRLRQRGWPLSDFKGISYGSQGGTGRGFFLSVRLHGHHQGQMLLSFLIANTREETIIIARRLSELTGLPLLPEMTTGPQYSLDDMRKKSRWAYLSRSK